MLNDPQFPARPQHPDFWKLSDVILQLDSQGEAESDAFATAVGEVVDMESLQYMAYQRALRVHAVANGIDPRDGRIPRELVEGPENQQAIIAIVSAYMEAFIVGHRFANRNSDG